MIYTIVSRNSELFIWSHVLRFRLCLVGVKTGRIENRRRKIRWKTVLFGWGRKMGKTKNPGESFLS